MSDLRGPLLPLTAAQSGVWYAQQLNPQNTIFNTGEFLEINGPVDAELFEASLRRVVTEAETLRLRFLEAEGGPAARLVPAADLDWSLHVVDVSDAPNPWTAARAWMAEDFATPLDTEHDQLFLFALFKVAEDRHLWLHRYHHLLVDGFTVNMVVQRTAAVYSALVAGEPVPDTPSPRWPGCSTRRPPTGSRSASAPTAPTGSTGSRKPPSPSASPASSRPWHARWPAAPPTSAGPRPSGCALWPPTPPSPGRPR